MVLGQLVLKLDEIIHGARIVGVDSDPLAPLVQRVNGVETDRYLSLQVVGDGFLRQQQRSSGLALLGTVVIMTATLRMRPHGLEGISAANDEQIEAGLYQRGGCTQSSLHGSPPFQSRTARALCADMSASNFRQTVAANTSFRRRRHFSGLSWFEQPPRSRSKQARALHQTQEVVLPNENVEVTGAVPPVLLVVEVNPEPSASPAIEEVKRPRFLVALNRYEQQ